MSRHAQYSYEDALEAGNGRNSLRADPGAVFFNLVI